MSIDAKMFTKAQLIERIHGIDSRREKGLLITMAGLVRIVRDTDRYYCPSAKFDHFYMQKFVDDFCYRTYMDNQNRGHEYTYCKHLWACIEAENRDKIILVDKLSKECFLSV